MRKLKLEELNRMGLDDYKEKAKHPIIVVLDNVRSAMNVGSVFRTCDAFASEKLYLVGITAKPPHKEITKTAIGATESVDWEHRENGLELMNELKDQGYHLIGIEQTDQSVSLEKFQYPNQKIAIVMGNEVEGINDDFLSVLDECIEVPQFGTKHSLNVSVCTGIVLWDHLKSTKYTANV